MASLFRLLGGHARQAGVQDIQDRRGLENGLERLPFFLNFSSLAKKGRRMMECTFACFDFARFDFFLLMIVLNQSPDPMASTGLLVAPQRSIRIQVRLLRSQGKRRGID